MTLLRCRVYWTVYYNSPHSFIYNIFLLVGITTLGTFMEILIGRLIRLIVQTFQPLVVIYRGVILRIIIGDVHQFIGHCLNPLVP